MLNEMSDGNFAIDTECEEVYTGAFTDLLTGIRKMNEEIATTVRGVDDASGQVLTGSTNLAEAAQSLAEGDRKSTRLNSSHPPESRMPSSA